MATLVHSATSVISSGGSVTITSTTAGNTLVVAVANPDNRSIDSITDNKGGGSSTYTIDNDIQSGGFGAAICSTSNIAAGITSVTVTLSASSTTVHVDVMEFSGIATSSYVGSTAFNGDNGTSLTVLPFSPGSPAAGSVIVAVGSANNRTWTAGSNYTAATSPLNQNALAEYRLSSSGSETCPMSIDASSSWAEAAVEYKVAGGGGGGTVTGIFQTTNKFLGS